jgi:hypothetical protein
MQPPRNPMTAGPANTSEQPTSPQPAATVLAVEPSWRAILAEHSLDTLDALFRVTGDRELTKPGLPSWRRRIRLELASSVVASRVLYLKRYKTPPLGQQVRRIVSGRAWRSTAWIEWNWMRTLARCDVAAAEPVAFGEEMIGPWERRSAVLIAGAPGQSLERWVQSHPERVPPALRDHLARFVWRFHRGGFVHRDLYLSHIFMDRAESEVPSFRLIDVFRVHQPRWRRQRWVVKDLAALNYSTPAGVATTADRVRWLQVYLGVPRLSAKDKVLVRKIVAKTRRLARHDRRRRQRSWAPKELEP